MKLVKNIKKSVPQYKLNSYIARVCSLLLGLFVNFTNKPRVSAVILAPGGGNIGDQAMLEAYLENVSGKVLLIATHRHKVEIPKHHLSRAESMVLTGLIYGGVKSFVKDFIRFVLLTRSFKSLSIIGADIMDGGYNVHASVMRASIAYLVKEFGIQTRVLGFSWKENANQDALESIKMAGAAGVKLYARDPKSYKRLKNSEVDNVIQVSDTVFSDLQYSSNGVEPALAFMKSGRTVIVNASGLINKGFNQVKEYETIIKTLLNNKYNVLILPHVIRDGANDLTICRELAEVFPNAFFVDFLLSPSQVKCLVKEAYFVITGRMHLSIMSLNALVPAIVLSTQGKVEGLMEFFELPSFSVSPENGFGEKISSMVVELDSNYSSIMTNLNNNIVKVRQLSIKNFEGI